MFDLLRRPALDRLRGRAVGFSHRAGVGIDRQFDPLRAEAELNGGLSREVAQTAAGIKQQVIAGDLVRRESYAGGFGGAPKFPNPMAFSFLWRMQLAAPDGGQAREAVLITLRKMAEGGIFDQLGGGFHRYSVDDT